MKQPQEQTRPSFNRQHGDRLDIATRRGRKVSIPCPRCRKLTETRFWHRPSGKGVCDRCWRQLEQDRLPAALD